MRKTTGIVASSLVILALVTCAARAELLFESDRVLDTRTGLAWLNVWQGEPLVNRDRLVDVAGGWRLATGAEIRDLFFVQFGLPPLNIPPGSAPAFDPRVAQLILHLGGASSRSPDAPPGGEPDLYGIYGWYRSDFYPERAPTFDAVSVTYRYNPFLGGWIGADVSSIGSYTSVPPRFQSPIAYFLVTPLVPEPPGSLLLAAGLAAAGLARRYASRRPDTSDSVAARV